MNKNNRIQIIYFLIGFFAFMYVFIRAITVGITYDEAWTINDFVNKDYLTIFRCDYCDANNHILNSFLIKLFFETGNESLFLARFPNVLAFILYLYFGYKITSKYLSPMIGILCFLTLIFNPFLLDFFSLARGYGLSFGLMMASLYYLLYFINSTKTKAVLFSYIFGMLAVLSNFTLLNYWLILLMVSMGFSILESKRFKIFPVSTYALLTSLTLFIIVYNPIKKLKENGFLYYGGNSDFYNDTLVSLTNYFLYNSESNPNVYLILNIFLILILGIIFWVFLTKKELLNNKNVLLSLLILGYFSIESQHVLLGTPYLIDRTALFFYPIVILVLCFFINEINSQKIGKLISLFIGIFFGINFLINANFYKTVHWYFDAHSEEILDSLNEIGKVENKKIKIDYSWPFQSSIGYYLKQNKYPYIENIQNSNNREAVDSTAEYYIYLNKLLVKDGYDAHFQKILSIPKDTFETYKKEGIIVFNLTK